MDIEQQFLKLLDNNRRQIAGVCHYYSTIMGAPLSEDDLFQDVLLNLWTSYPKYIKRPHCHTSTWVYRIALNVCISHYRKAGKKTQLPLDEHSVELLEDLEDKEMVSHLYHLIRQLDQEEQTLIFLYIDEKSHKEIADIMGISISNVGTRIQRIKMKLKQMNDGRP